MLTRTRYLIRLRNPLTYEKLLDDLQGAFPDYRITWVYGVYDRYIEVRKGVTSLTIIYSAYHKTLEIVGGESSAFIQRLSLADLLLSFRREIRSRLYHFLSTAYS